MEVDSTICAGLGGHVLTGLESSSQANTFDGYFPQIIGFVIPDLLIISFKSYNVHLG